MAQLGPLTLSGELADLLQEKGVNVRYAIHPVAGRMPGHMNVLLAEADVPYPKLLEMEDANEDMGSTDVVLVIGANDVVNPAARHDTSSPLYGMPILDVDKARTCVVVKRSLSPGFAGIPNPLFAADNTLMLFGDGKGIRFNPATYSLDVVDADDDVLVDLEDRHGKANALLGEDLRHADLAAQNPIWFRHGNTPSSAPN